MKLWFLSIAVGLAMAFGSAARAETFFLEDGGVLEGTVLRSLGNSLSIKLDPSGMHQLPLDDIDSVEIITEDGGRVTGRLGWWANGVYGLVTPEGLIEVRDGVVTNVVDSGAAPEPVTEIEPLPVGSDQGTVAPALPPLDAEEQPKKLEPTM